MDINKYILVFILPIAIFSLSTCDSKSEPLPTSRAEWRALLKWDDVCESGVWTPKQRPNFVGVNKNEWTNSSSMITVVCELGAYQYSAIVYHVKETGAGRQVTLLEFPQFHHIEPETEPGVRTEDGLIDFDVEVPADTVDLFYRFAHRKISPIPIFDKETKIIIHNNIHLGCGQRTIYKLVDGEPHVVEFRSRPHCRSFTVPIEKWKLYPKETWQTWPLRVPPEDWFMSEKS